MDKFKGKRIRVRIPARGSDGKVDPTLPAAVVEGLCTFSGSNRTLGIDFMVTIDRSPVFPIKESDIEVLK
jgi:hypothetical protein